MDLEILSNEFILLPYVSGMILLEYLIRLFAKHKVDYKDNISSILIGIIYFGGLLLSKGILYGAAFFVYEFRLFEIPAEFFWWTLPAFVVFREFGWYWFHRASHEIRFLWCIHKTHHSATDLSFATAIRMPFFEIFASLPVGLTAVFIGMHPAYLPAVEVFSLMYGLVIHTQLVKKLGKFEAFTPFTTPSHHRVHHGANIKYLDRNYGGTLIIYDKIFGSFQLEEETVTIGLRQEVETYNPIMLNLFGFIELWQDVKRAPGMLNKLKYVLYPPGWSHDGPNTSSRVLQKNIGSSQSVSA